MPDATIYLWCQEFIKKLFEKLFWCSGYTVYFQSKVVGSNSEKGCSKAIRIETY